MPHIIVEYSENIREDVSISALLADLHETLAAQETVDLARIKTRAIRLDDYVVADKGPTGMMIHVTLLLLEGRDVALRKKLGAALHKVARAAAAKDCAVTLEVRDMHKDLYFA